MEVGMLHFWLRKCPLSVTLFLCHCKPEPKCNISGKVPTSPTWKKRKINLSPLFGLQCLNFIGWAVLKLVMKLSPISPYGQCTLLQNLTRWPPFFWLFPALIQIGKWIKLSRTKIKLILLVCPRYLKHVLLTHLPSRCVLTFFPTLQRATSQMVESSALQGAQTRCI